MDEKLPRATSGRSPWAAMRRVSRWRIRGRLRRDRPFDQAQPERRVAHAHAGWALLSQTPARGSRQTSMVLALCSITLPRPRRTRRRTPAAGGVYRGRRLGAARHRRQSEFHARLPRARRRARTSRPDRRGARRRAAAACADAGVQHRDRKVRVPAIRPACALPRRNAQGRPARVSAPFRASHVPRQNGVWPRTFSRADKQMSDTPECGSIWSRLPR